MLATGAVRPADVLKVAHHGSAHQAPELLAAVRPRVALVSAGADNDYGHPAATTLRDLRRAGAAVARTDRQRDAARGGHPASAKGRHRWRVA